MTSLHVSPGHLTLDALRSLWVAPRAVTLDEKARARIDAAADTVAGVISEGRVVYGVNTGFGLLARTHIDAARLADLQRALVLSHSAGTGPPLDAAVVRLILALKIASLARGYSGVRFEVIDALLKLVNADVVPVVPSQGSVGASGDLAPLAHLAGVLIGEGEARVGGATLPAAEALRHAGIAPLKLAA
jgi:histidine ammonia-lyase